MFSRAYTVALVLAALYFSYARSIYLDRSVEYEFIFADEDWQNSGYLLHTEQEIRFYYGKYFSKCSTMLEVPTKLLLNGSKPGVQTPAAILESTFTLKRRTMIPSRSANRFKKRMEIVGAIFTMTNSSLTFRRKVDYRFLDWFNGRVNASFFMVLPARGALVDNTMVNSLRAEHQWRMNVTVELPQPGQRTFSTLKDYADVLKRRDEYRALVAKWTTLYGHESAQCMTGQKSPANLETFGSCESTLSDDCMSAPSPILESKSKQLLGTFRQPIAEASSAALVDEPSELDPLSQAGDVGSNNPKRKLKLVESLAGSVGPIKCIMNGCCPIGPKLFRKVSSANSLSAELLKSHVDEVGVPFVLPNNPGLLLKSRSPLNMRLLLWDKIKKRFSWSSVLKKVSDHNFQNDYVSEVNYVLDMYVKNRPVFQELSPVEARRRYANSMPHAHNECPICMESFWTDDMEREWLRKSRFGGRTFIKSYVDNPVFKTECNHHFCKNCLNSHTLINPHNPRCPLCRTKLE